MVVNQPKFNTMSLREQVCNYLKKEIGAMSIRPGDTISLRKVSGELGIGITPLRDALLQLEGEGMVTIMPRKGIVLREFTLKDVENYYETLGIIEEHALITAIEHITPEHCTIMRQIDKQLDECTARQAYADYRTLNKTFHNIYLNLSSNSYFATLWNNIVPKLYYCPVNIVQMVEWDNICTTQHENLIDALEAKDLENAIYWMKDEHWSFKKQKKYLQKYYDLGKAR